MSAQRQKGSGPSNVTRRRREKPPPRREEDPPHSKKKRIERKTCRRPAAAADQSEDSEITPPPKPKTTNLSYYLERLSWTKGSDREAALASIIERLVDKFMEDYDLLEENLTTFLHRCLNARRKASPVEKQLSLQAIGLLAVIVRCEDKLSEIYGQLLPLISKSLKSGHEAAVKMLDCLAVVGFFGATNSEETETAMQVVWKFISDPESTKKLSAEVLVAGIYAWLFLLTSMEGWRLSHSYWNGAISYFSNLLEHSDKSVCVAASEALALIFEIGSLDKFWSSEAKDPSAIKYSRLQQFLRENVLQKLKSVYSDMRGSENAAKKVRQVVIYFESFRCPGAFVTVNGNDLKLSSWYQMNQLQFLKGFLADGFKEHMKENEKLWSLFEFDPRRNNVGQELYASTTDEISVRFFLPEERDSYMLTNEARKKERVWRNCLLDKARTQLMSKQRLLSQEMNSCICA